MVQLDDVEVYITRHKDDRRFKEYRVPITSDKYRADPNEVYIEAVTNERFEVNVRLLRGFDWKGFPNVRITYDIDGTSYVGFLYKNPSNVAREDRRRDQLGEVGQTIGGRTVVCGLAFDNGASMTVEEAREQEDKIGYISVKVNRGRFENARARSPEGMQFPPPDDVDVGTNCEKVIEKQGVSHALKHLPLYPLPEEEAIRASGSRRIWGRAAGSAGRTLCFTVRYRSKRSLGFPGLLGDDDYPGPCLPCPEKAGPDPKAGSESNDEENEDLLNRINSPNEDGEIVIRGLGPNGRRQGPGTDAGDLPTNTFERPSATLHGNNGSNTEEGRNLLGALVRGITESARNKGERRDADENQASTPKAADHHPPAKRSLLVDLSETDEDNEAELFSRSRAHSTQRYSPGTVLSDSGDSSEGELVGPGQRTPVRNGNAWPQQSTSEEHEQRRKRAHSEIRREEKALDREEKNFMAELKRWRKEIAKTKCYVDSC